MINVDEVGVLNRRIDILKYRDTVDKHRLTHQELVDAIGNSIWARIEPARGRTYYEQYKDKVELLTKITIRYRPGINEDMVVRYNDHIYKITSVVDPYDAHVKLELMCNIKRIGDSNVNND